MVLATSRISAPPQLLADHAVPPPGEGVQPGLDGLGGAQQRLLQVDQAVAEVPVEHRQHQLLLAVEVGVDGALGEAGQLGHPLERRAPVAVLEELVGGHLEQALARDGLALST
nr:hypothetical protein [Aquihabitans sp. G128]